MKPDPGKNLKDYAKYSGIAFQMMAIIVAGAVGGWKTDQWLSTGPLFTVTLSILSVFIAIYISVKDLLKK